jgi:hypothetical protein
LIDRAVRRLIINADDFGLTRGVNRDRMAVGEEQGLGSQLLLALSQPQPAGFTLHRSNHIDFANAEPSLAISSMSRTMQWNWNRLAGFP